MKTFLKILGILAGVVVLLVVAGLIYFNSAFPDVDPPKDVKVEITPARLERGKYLANHVTVCIDCHSSRDWSKFSGPVVPGTEGKGGDVFDENVGMPGKVSVKNITPAAIGNWSDGELIRTITMGVNKDGKALFPIMPYYSFTNLTQEDLYSIVAYVRSLHPVKNDNIPETELNFPLNMIVKTMPIKTYKPAKEIDKSNTIAYGKYLAAIASCGDCHTQSDKGQPLPGMEFAGGADFKLPWGLLKSANITPHPTTGIGSWSKEQFIQRFKAYDPDSTAYMPVSAGEFNSIMPWTMYAGMTTEDLGAIYDYLKTLKPVNNNVTRFTPAKTVAAK